MRRVFVPASLLLAACPQEVVGLVPKPDDSEPPLDTDVGLPLDQPDIAVSPESLDFGGWPLHCTTPERVVTVTNQGTADLEISKIELVGPGKDTFAVRGRKQRLAPGESFDLRVAFTPTQYADYADVRIRIESNDPDEPTTRVPVRGVGAETAYAEELFIQEEGGAVDVLWLIDNSCSMDDELSKLGSSFDTFITNFATLGLDYQIAVTSTDGSGTCARFRGPLITSSMTPADAKQEFIRQATTVTYCGGESGFDGAYAALTDPQNLATGFLRDGATLAVVAVSDEEEQAQIAAVKTPQLFANWLLNLKPDPDMVSFSAMCGPQSGGFFGGCKLTSGSDAEAAPRYHAAIRLTGGVWGNLCNFQVVPFLTHLSYVAAGLEFRFPLSQVPTSYASNAIRVTVDGQAVPYGTTEGWTYDADANAVELHGSAIPEPGAEVVIQYPVEAVCSN